MFDPQGLLSQHQNQVHGIVKIIVFREIRVRHWEWSNFVSGRILTRNPRDRFLPFFHEGSKGLILPM